MPEPETNEHTELEEPRATYYVVGKQWYVEIIVPHPDSAEQPPQSMTFPVDNEWWGFFIADLVESMSIEHWQALIQDNYKKTSFK
jgi:hypothetical protein